VVTASVFKWAPEDDGAINGDCVVSIRIGVCWEAKDDRFWRPEKVEVGGGVSVGDAAADPGRIKTGDVLAPLDPGRTADDLPLDPGRIKTGDVFALDSGRKTGGETASMAN
jgi:hypothetical protein